MSIEVLKSLKEFYYEPNYVDLNNKAAHSVVFSFLAEAVIYYFSLGSLFDSSIDSYNKSKKSKFFKNNKVNKVSNMAISVLPAIFKFFLKTLPLIGVIISSAKIFEISQKEAINAVRRSPEGKEAIDGLFKTHKNYQNEVNRLRSQFLIVTKANNVEQIPFSLYLEFVLLGRYGLIDKEHIRKATGEEAITRDIDAEQEEKLKLIDREIGSEFKKKLLNIRKSIMKDTTKMFEIYSDLYKKGKIQQYQRNIKF